MGCLNRKVLKLHLIGSGVVSGNFGESSKSDVHPGLDVLKMWGRGSSIIG